LTHLPETPIEPKLYVTDGDDSFGGGNRVQVFDITGAAPVPFDFSPNLAIGALGAVVITKKLLKKKKLDK